MNLTQLESILWDLYIDILYWEWRTPWRENVERIWKKSTRIFDGRLRGEQEKVCKTLMMFKGLQHTRTHHERKEKVFFKNLKIMSSLFVKMSHNTSYSKFFLIILNLKQTNNQEHNIAFSFFR